MPETESTQPVGLDAPTAAVVNALYPNETLDEIPPILGDIRVQTARHAIGAYLAAMTPQHPAAPETEQAWVNLDYPHMSEGWHFPTPNGREHYFRDGRSFCGRYRIEPGARIAGRMDQAEDPCVTCNRVVTAEMARLWCEHGDPRNECPDCLEESR